jgi:hypothetical protein
MGHRVSAWATGAQSRLIIKAARILFMITGFDRQHLHLNRATIPRARAAAYLEPLIIGVDSRDRCGGGDDLDIETNYSAGSAGAALKSHEYQGTGLLVIRYDGKASLYRRHWNQFAIGRDRSMLDFWRGRNRRGALAIWRISCRRGSRTAAHWPRRRQGNFR